MDIKDIKKLLDAVAAAEVSEFRYETGDFKLEIRRGADPVVVSAPAAAPAAAPASPAPNEARPAAPAPAQQQPASAPQSDTGAEAASAPDPSLAEVTAPIVGTFYEAPAPDADPYVRVGDRVEPGTVLCIIEAMKLMNEIEAETAGTIREILVSNEDPVEYGQVLFRIDPD